MANEDVSMHVYEGSRDRTIHVVYSVRLFIPRCDSLVEFKHPGIMKVTIASRD